MDCRRCGAEASGNFCSNCGASLGERSCPACSSKVPAGSRFCTSCGVPLQGGGGGAAAASGARKGGSDLAWWVSGALLVVVVVFVAFVGPWGDDSDSQPATPAPPGGQVDPMGPAPQVDLSEMTEREAADRLFNRIMTAVSQGDTVEARNFLPMALDAYELAQPLDADGHFHLAVLQNLDEDFEGARETAERVLVEDPDHLLNLAAAAEAAAALGDSAAAAGHYRRLVEVFDQEVDRDLPEYREHAPLLPSLFDDASAFLAQWPDG